MAELKTKKNEASVAGFIASVPDERKRADAQALVDIFREITKAEPKMWGSSIVGFGDYQYKYESGREGEWFLAGFSPRKQNLTLYIMAGFDEYDDMLAKLGKHKTGKSCLYINRLEDVHVPTLKRLIRASVNHMKKGRK
jgi:hypothetical protein